MPGNISKEYRIARFVATQDGVPLTPCCNYNTNDFQFYKHVGMRVQLHGIGRIGMWRMKRNLHVTYPLYHDWLSEIKRALMNNILAHFTTISGKWLRIIEHIFFFWNAHVLYHFLPRTQ
jgi:hypothetical protein